MTISYDDLFARAKSLGMKFPTNCQVQTYTVERVQQCVYMVKKTINWVNKNFFGNFKNNACIPKRIHV